MSMDAYGVLTGRKRLLPYRGGVRKRSSAHIQGSEAHEQIRFSTWLTKIGVLHYHIPNGGYRRFEEAMQLKAMGTMAGAPDTAILEPRGKYHGLYIEMKRLDGGRLSSAQTWWLAKLNEKGYLAQVAHGFEEAKEMVKRYLLIHS